MKTPLLALYAFLVLCPSPAVAQPPTPARPTGSVAYVSGQRLSTESIEGKAGQARLEAMRQEKANELRIRQQALEATRQQLALVAGGKEKLDLQQREQQQRADLDRATVQAQTDLQNLQRQLTVELQPKVRSALDDVVKGTDIQIVVQLETAVVWAAPGLDLTTAVLERLNAGVGTPVPAGGGGPR